MTHALALLSCLGNPGARRMLGGDGVVVDSHFVALILGDVLYLKADALARPAFEAAGCRPFGYATQTGQRAVLGYWRALYDAMESPGLLLP